VCVYAPNVLRDGYPLEELQGLRDCFAEQERKVDRMIDWARAQLDTAGLQSELVNFSVTPAEEGASGFVTAVAAR
jgi:hypothetical protein